MEGALSSESPSTRADRKFQADKTSRHLLAAASRNTFPSV
jgi:hypothetical protein